MNTRANSALMPQAVEVEALPLPMVPRLPKVIPPMRHAYGQVIDGNYFSKLDSLIINCFPKRRWFWCCKHQR